VSGQSNYAHEQVLAFGPYRLHRSQKLLLNADRPVRIGSRAFNILAALVERAGEVVSKRELIAYVWPNSYVEENNLRVHVAALRKVLGDGRGGVRYIVNVSGRGYCFVAPVQSLSDPFAVAVAQPPVPAGLPAPQTHVVGRAAVIDSIGSEHLLHVVGRKAIIDSIGSERLQHRLVTITGPGGVGKSTVALAVAENVFNAYEQRACLVDLTRVDDPQQVPSTLATLLGVSVLDNDPSGSIAAHLRSQQMLIVLDNCEHVIEPVANLVEHILRAAPHVQILATSREPLMAASETVVRLTPLPFPPESTSLTAAEAMRYPAIELFVQRAMSSADAFELTDDNAALIAEVCRHLDGIPLAIELAAARMDLLGLEGLANSLVDQLLLNARGRRTAHRRHISLRATLDWSYEVLSSKERLALQRLAIFCGPFSMDSAVAVVSDVLLSATDVMEGLISLVDKSLLGADISQQVTRFRLSRVTRAYALQKLQETEAEPALRQRHAVHFQELLQSAESHWDTTSRQQWLATYGEALEDVRAALDWAFSSKGDLQTGASLTAAALPFGAMFSLTEFKRWAQLAQSAIGRLQPRQMLIEMRIEVALHALYYLTGDTKELIQEAGERARALAREIGLPRYKIEPLHMLILEQIEQADYPAALNTLREMEQEARATDDPLALLITDKMGAQVHHWSGRHEQSRKLAERVLGHPAAAIPLAYAQMGMDRQLSMRVVLSRVFWLQGQYDRARELDEEAHTLAAQVGGNAQVQTLSLSGCQIAFWSGDIELANQRVAKLVSLTRRNGQLALYTLARCFQVAVSELAERSNRLDVGDAPMLVRPVENHHRDELATICDYWLDAETIAAAERSPHGWAAAEVLRAAGELSLRRRLPNCQADAESRFRRSLAIARSQGALTWELRTAISLGRLLKGQGRLGEAGDLIGPVLARIATKQAIADVTEARLLMASLQSSRVEKRLA
jgi:predicted ATPase/DNA-binding winged helix-turn-helix (wHTH) protein